MGTSKSQAESAIVLFTALILCSTEVSVVDVISRLWSSCTLIPECSTCNFLQKCRASLTIQ